jgi:hypothetical protein
MLPLFIFVLTEAPRPRPYGSFRMKRSWSVANPSCYWRILSHNSLPAALEILAKVTQDGGRGII